MRRTIAGPSPPRPDGRRRAGTGRRVFARTSDDGSLGSPHHEVRIQGARALRRASHDVPPAGQLRPAPDLVRHAHLAGAQARALVPRRVRQLRRGGELRGGSEGARLRHPHRARPHAVERARLHDRGLRPHLPVHLRGGGAAGHLAADRAAVPRPRAPARQMGAALRALRAAHRHGRALDDAHLRHQGKLHLFQALRARHAGPAADAVLRQGHLPRLRRADDGGGAGARLRVALRVGLPLRPARPGPGAQGRRQHPRLVPGLPAGRRLGGVRPHQRHRGQPRPDPRGGGARPAPGHPAPGQLFRQRRRLRRHDRVGGRPGDRGARRHHRPRRPARRAQPRRPGSGMAEAVGNAATTELEQA